MRADRSLKNATPCVLHRRLSPAVLRRNQQSHWHHRRFVEAMAPKEILGTNLRPIGEQGDAKEIFLFREIYRVLEQLRAVAVAAIFLMDDQIFQKNNEAALRRADRKEQIDHPDDRIVASQNKNATAIRLFEDQAQAAELLLPIRSKIAFFGK